MKKILVCVGLLVLAMAIFSGCSMRERDSGYLVFFGYGDADVPPVVSIENGTLRLEFLTETAEIILTDLRTGDQFRSTPEGVAEYEDISEIERFIAQSLFVMDFQRRTGSGQPFDSYRFAMRTGRFEHEIFGSGADAMMELRFTVGNIDETFHIPDAIYAERLTYFLGNAGVDRTGRLRVMGEFNAVTLARPPSGMDEAEVREMFPTLDEDGRIYMLGDANISQLRFIEGVLRSGGYTVEEWEADMAYFNIPTEIAQPAFNVFMQFTLEDDAMVLTVPMRPRPDPRRPRAEGGYYYIGISYVPQYMPTRLTILPYFGAALAQDEGYMFVPDGSGAIMFHDSRRYTQRSFASNVFGHDEAIIRDSVLFDNSSPYPVFGIYRNGATFAAIIEEGSSYASVVAEVAGIRGPHSRVHPRFRLLHGAPLDVAGRSNDSLYMHEWDLPDEDIVIRYVITGSDNNGYVGMAHAYRDFLQARYPWLNERVSTPVHAMMEILGAALTPQHILGFPVERPFPLTSYAQAEEMMQDLHDLGWRNLHVKLRGAHNDSIDHAVPTRLRLISQMGGRRGFDSLVNVADDLDFVFYLEADFMFMRHLSWFDGFSPMRDAARQANRERAEHSGYSPTYFGAWGSGSILADPVVVARPEFMINTARNFVDDAAGRGVTNMAFRSMASALAGDFNEDRHVTREYSMNMRREFLSEIRGGNIDAGIRGNDMNIWLNHGFSFGVPFADVITNMPLTDQNFAIVCTSVPFLQIALHGLVPFAGGPLNLAEDHSYDLLKSIEAGASLFFSFMYLPTAELDVTGYRRYFANEFQRWVETADRLYHQHLENFGHLYNQLITDHQILHRSGVTVTIYEDGTRVYVNTTPADFVAPSGITIGAMNYHVVR